MYLSRISIVSAIIASAISLATGAAHAQEGPTAAGHDATLEAYVTDATRKDNVLTVKVRFKPIADTNTSSVYDGKVPYESIFVVAGEKKYMLLKDSSGVPLTSPNVKGTYFNEAQAKRPFVATWYGKFPAPPSEVKDFSLSLPDFESLDSIPIADK